jgi:hypothetical protein
MHTDASGYFLPPDFEPHWYTLVERESTRPFGIARAWRQLSPATQGVHRENFVHSAHYWYQYNCGECFRPDGKTLAPCVFCGFDLHGIPRGPHWKSRYCNQRSCSYSGGAVHLGRLFQLSSRECHARENGQSAAGPRSTTDCPQRTRRLLEPRQLDGSLLIGIDN